MWAHARYDLGLTEAEFWSLSPDLLERLSKRWQDEQHRENQRVGVLCAVLVKVMTGKGMKPTDFFPERTEAQTAEQMAAALEALARVTEAKRGATDNDQRG